MSASAGGMKKYQFPPNMFDAESKETTIHLTDSQMHNELEMMLSQSYMGDEDPERRKEYKHAQARLRQKGFKSRINKEFADDFIAWLSGRSKYSVETAMLRVMDEKGQPVDIRPVECTPWGNKPLTHLPDVCEFLDQAIDRRAEAAKIVARLRMRMPTTLNEAYLYYKYIVRRQAIDDAGALQELSEFGKFDWPVKPDPNPGPTGSGEIVTGPIDPAPPRFEATEYNKAFNHLFTTIKSAVSISDLPSLKSVYASPEYNEMLLEDKDLIKQLYIFQAVAIGAYPAMSPTGTPAPTVPPYPGATIAPGGLVNPNTPMPSRTMRSPTLGRRALGPGAKYTKHPQFALWEELFAVVTGPPARAKAPTPAPGGPVLGNPPRPRPPVPVPAPAPAPPAKPKKAAKPKPPKTPPAATAPAAPATPTPAQVAKTPSPAKPGLIASIKNKLPFGLGTPAKQASPVNVQPENLQGDPKEVAKVLEEQNVIQFVKNARVTLDKIANTDWFDPQVTPEKITDEFAHKLDVAQRLIDNWKVLDISDPEAAPMVNILSELSVGSENHRLAREAMEQLGPRGAALYTKFASMSNENAYAKDLAGIKIYKGDFIKTVEGILPPSIDPVMTRRIIDPLTRSTEKRPRLTDPEMQQIIEDRKTTALRMIGEVGEQDGATIRSLVANQIVRPVLITNENLEAFRDLSGTEHDQYLALVQKQMTRLDQEEIRNTIERTRNAIDEYWRHGDSQVLRSMIQDASKTTAQTWKEAMIDHYKFKSEQDFDTYLFGPDSSTDGAKAYMQLRNNQLGESNSVMNFAYMEYWENEKDRIERNIRGARKSEEFKRLRKLSTELQKTALVATDLALADQATVSSILKDEFTRTLHVTDSLYKEVHQLNGGFDFGAKSVKAHPRIKDVQDALIHDFHSMRKVIQDQTPRMYVKLFEKFDEMRLDNGLPAYSSDPSFEANVKKEGAMHYSASMAARSLLVGNQTHRLGKFMQMMGPQVNELGLEQHNWYSIFTDKVQAKMNAILANFQSREQDVHKVVNDLVDPDMNVNLAEAYKYLFDRMTEIDQDMVALNNVVSAAIFNFSGLIGGDVVAAAHNVLNEDYGTTGNITRILAEYQKQPVKHKMTKFEKEMNKAVKEMFQKYQDEFARQIANIGFNVGPAQPSDEPTYTRKPKTPTPEPEPAPPREPTPPPPELVEPPPALVMPKTQLRPLISPKPSGFIFPTMEQPLPKPEPIPDKDKPEGFSFPGLDKAEEERRKQNALALEQMRAQRLERERKAKEEKENKLKKEMEDLVRKLAGKAATKSQKTAFKARLKQEQAEAEQRKAAKREEEERAYAAMYAASEARKAEKEMWTPPITDAEYNAMEEAALAEYKPPEAAPPEREPTPPPPPEPPREPTPPPPEPPLPEDYAKDVDVNSVLHTAPIRIMTQLTKEICKQAYPLLHPSSLTSAHDKTIIMNIALLKLNYIHAVNMVKMPDLKLLPETAYSKLHDFAKYTAEIGDNFQDAVEMLPIKDNHNSMVNAWTRTSVFKDFSNPHITLNNAFYAYAQHPEAGGMFRSGMNWQRGFIEGDKNAVAKSKTVAKNVGSFTSAYHGGSIPYAATTYDPEAFTQPSKAISGLREVAFIIPELTFGATLAANRIMRNVGGMEINEVTFEQQMSNYFTSAIHAHYDEHRLGELPTAKVLNLRIRSQEMAEQFAKDIEHMYAETASAEGKGHKVITTRDIIAASMLLTTAATNSLKGLQGSDWMGNMIHPALMESVFYFYQRTLAAPRPTDVNTNRAKEMISSNKYIDYSKSRQKLALLNQEHVKTVAGKSDLVRELFPNNDAGAVLAKAPHLQLTKKGNEHLVKESRTKALIHRTPLVKRSYSVPPPEETTTPKKPPPPSKNQPGKQAAAVPFTAIRRR